MKYMEIYAYTSIFWKKKKNVFFAVLFNFFLIDRHRIVTLSVFTLMLFSVIPPQGFYHFSWCKCYHFWSSGRYHFCAQGMLKFFCAGDVIIFECRGCYHFSWCECYHFEVLDVIILCAGNVIIFVSSRCYHFWV